MLQLDPSSLTFMKSLFRALGWWQRLQLQLQIDLIHTFLFHGRGFVVANLPLLLLLLLLQC